MESENEDDDKPKHLKKKVSDVVPLIRPIIFICNDLYAKALAPLREIALTIKIAEANYERLVNRLSFICKNEQV